MGTVHFFWVLSILGSLFTQNVWSSPIGTTEIHCETGSPLEDVGSTDEGYEGEVELLTGIRAEDRLELEPYLFPIGITFVELVYTPGDTTARIRTTKPLDADALKETNGEAYYSVKCTNTGLLSRRKLIVRDINNNPPIFQEEEYKVTVSETHAVDTVVERVLAVDADASTENNRVTYSIRPPAPSAFELRNDGAVLLKERLNYNTANHYSFIVEARDNGGLNDTTTVVVEVTDFDNLNPYFDHRFYQASIQENQVGSFATITPAAIKAQDGDTGINEPVVYSITAVSPSKYRLNFNIDPTTGVITVATALDREEITVQTIILDIKAAQQNDNSKEASAVVSVTVVDLNDNNPEFDQSEYSVEIPENSPTNSFVLQAKVTDLDQGGFVGTLRIIPDTAPFSVSRDGAITVKTSAALDRETVTGFTFQIEASEDALPNHTVTASVNVTLLDDNDNSPQFGSSKYEGKVFNNQTVNMLVATVEATDSDEGPNGQVKYSIDFGNQEGYFSIDENMGQIRLNKSGTVSRFASVLVDVKAPGDSRPQFLERTYQGSVEEEREAGAEILKVSFLSVAPAVPVTFSVETEEDKFSISSTGVLSTRVKLDYEATKNYTIQLSLTDGTNRDEASVTVTVIDVNDNRPVFATSPVTVMVAEDLEVGANVTTVTATDADAGLNGEIRYALQGGAGRFRVEPGSGLITVAAALDRETQDEFRLEVVATDQGRPSRSATAAVTVTVSDVNDNAPSFAKPQYEVTVLETVAAGTVLIDVMATDADEGPSGTVTYQITKQEPAGKQHFALDPATGSLSLAKPLDYGQVRRFTLEVEAADGGTPSMTGVSVVIVWVQDVKDSAPQFSQERYDVSVPENLASGAAIITLEVTDEDEGGFSNGHFLLTSDTFSINKQGVVSLKSDSSLDREIQDSYILQVTAVDAPTAGLNTTTSVNVTVLDVNDNNPHFLPLPDPIAIAEGEYTPASPGEVCRIVAEDTDLGENGRVTISTPSYGHLFTFKADGTLQAVGELDREMEDGYDLVIIATDHGTPQRKNITNIRVTVTDVNDNSPVFSADSYTKSILVKDAKAGDVVLTLLATDKDAGDNALITYSVNVTLLDDNDNSPQFGSSKYEGKVFNNQTVNMLVATVEATDSDEGPNGQVKYSIDFGNQEGYFSIDENMGQIRLNKSGTVSRFASVLVDVKAPGDSRPQFLERTYQGSVEEEREAGAEILKVSFLSVAPAVPVTFSVETEEDKFSISSTGVLSTRVKLDYEATKNYTIQLSLTDGTNRDEASVTVTVIDVNDNRPVFATSPVTVMVAEDLEVGANVTTVTATDADAGLNGEIRYALQGGAGRFRVEPGSGLITVAAALDRETQDEFRLEVVATDQGRPSRSATAAVTVTVSDVNDNAPSFAKPQYEVTVLETVAAGTVLIDVMATDADEGPSGTVTYQITKQEPAGKQHFALDPATGSLSLAKPLDYGQVRRFTLEVEAADGGTPSMTGVSVVIVWVQDVKDSAPQFSQERYDVSVPENLASGAAIITLEVTDEDEGGFSNGHFLLTSDTFSINKQGVVSLKSDSSLDREIQDSYILQVTAVDAPTAGLNTTTSVNVTVLDVNDNNPHFLPLPDPIAIAEGEYTPASPGEVCRIVAEDTDLGENGRVTISTPSYGHLFTFKADGTLQAVGELDREMEDGYDLVIIATDHGTPQRKNITNIRVTVTDVNDNSPVFSADSYTKSILVKDAKAGDVVLTLLATDKDAGDNALITYSFSEDSPMLTLDSTKGVITLTSDLSGVTEDTLLNLTALATDNGMSPRSSTATVLVSLMTVSLAEGVAFESSSYNFSMAENEPKGTELGVVRASPGSSLFNVTYVLTSHTDLFSVDAEGVIQTLRPLDRETEDFYIFSVEAVDSRTPPNTALTMVTVEVENVNEAPVFDSESYQAKIFSIAPYKFPVVQVKATDPDVGESGRLEYKLAEASAVFDVERASGQVYVVSAAGQAGKVTLKVNATDEHSRTTTTTVKVTVQESASSNVVVMTLNQPTNTVEKNVLQMQDSLKNVLGWNVNVISVTSDSEIRSFRREAAAAKTYVSFITTDTGGAVIPAGDVRNKLMSEAESVKAALEEVFGSGLEHAVEEDPATPNNQSVIIALSVLLTLCLVGFVVQLIVFVIRRKKRLEEPDREIFDVVKSSESYTNGDIVKSGKSEEEQRVSHSERKSSQGSEREVEDSDASHTSAF